MSECSLLGWLNFGILLLTAGVITWYTMETYRLRKEAQLQTELETRPFLSVIYEGHRQDATVLIVNLGKGLARNVRVADIILDRTMELRGQTITHIAPGQEVPPPWRAWVRVTKEDPIGEVPSEDHVSTVVNAISQNTVRIVMTYASLVDQHYRTVVRISDGLAEIVTDERIPKGC